MLNPVLSSFLFCPCGALGQVHRMMFLPEHSAALALLWSRCLCCNGSAPCPLQGSAGRDILPGLCFWCFSVNAFFPAWLPEAAPPAQARQAWLKAQDSKSMVATAVQGLYSILLSMQIPAESPLLNAFVHAGSQSRCGLVLLEER